MRSPDDGTGPAIEPQYPLAARVRRSLKRRFPRATIAYNWLRAKAGHYLGKLTRPRPRNLVGTLRWSRELLTRWAARRREPRLTVAVDVTALWEPLTGIGWYLYRLLEEAAGRDDVRLRLYGPTVVDSPDREAAVVPLPIGPAIEPVLYAVPEDLLLPRGLVIRLLRRCEPLLIALDANEVLFAPNYFLPRRFHFAGGARVATIHDLGLRKVPWTLRRATLEELTAKLEHALFEAHRLITVSAAVRDELAGLGYAARRRVHAIHHGPGHLAEVEPGALPAAAPERFGLHVGTLEPRKNILGLLAAWRALRRRLPEAPPLLLSGRFGWKTDEIRAAVDAGVREGWLLHLGYVSESELAALYRRAAVVVFPTLYEGFGLPAIEALWAGAPLVASDLPVLREVAGDAALYAPPDRPEELAERIREVLTDAALRARLAERGRARAGELSWATTVERTLAVWREAAGRGRSDG